MSKKKYTFLVLCISCFVFFYACSNSPTINPAQDSPTSGSISITVDESFKPVIEQQIKIYEADFPGTKINALYKSEADCFRDLYYDSATRMVIVTRGLSKKEAKFFQDTIAYSPPSDPIAWDAISIVVNKNSTDTLFTLQKLQQLLIGKGNKNQSIIFDGLNATSTVRFVTDSILKGQTFDTAVVKAAKNSMIDQFNRTVNTSNKVRPFSSNFVYDGVVLSNIAMVESAPLVQLQQQQIELSEKLVAVEKSKLNPSFSVGYSSMTINGWQAISQSADKYFGSSDRFGTVSVGLMVPIFSAAQKARISAGSILVKQKKLEETAVKQEVEQKIQRATALFIQYKRVLDGYHKKGLPGARLLMQTATQKLTAGDINYLDWVMLMNQSIQTRADYYNAVMSYNEAAFELEKLNSIQ